MKNKYKAMVLLGLTLALTTACAQAGNESQADVASKPSESGPFGLDGNALAILGAALGVGIAGIGASRGLAISGSTAAAAVGENENNFSSAITIGVMPQTQVVYAFIISILIILGLMSKSLTVAQGWFSLGAGLAVGIAGISSIGQGIVASAAIGAAAKNPATKGKGLIFVVLPEAAALFGFVTGILLLVAGGVF